LHKATFVLWFGVLTIHVLTYVWRLPRMLSLRAVPSGGRADAGWIRVLLVAGSLLGGVAIALLLVHLVHPWETGVR
jgi:hypothetical protein